MANFSTYSEWSNFISTHFFKGLEEAGSRVAEAFRRDVSPNVPFLHGDLKGSIDMQIAVSSNQITITFTWDTEYGQRQYWEHSEKGEWDIRTWEVNKEAYSQILASIIIKNLGG